MVQNKLFSKLRMFWSKLCKSNWNCAWNLTFPVFISPMIVWNMCENLHYESVYFKNTIDRQYTERCYWPTIYTPVSTITSYTLSTRGFSRVRRGIFGVGRGPTHLRCLLFARVTIKTWQKPETALEKSLAPRIQCGATATCTLFGSIWEFKK